ncbi:MAG: hypothetical protein KAJ17_08640, partial [Candidatus Krumholzibacteria bacterium]|nr:hypothetical protein [Candidatus Krumholzibacteria bacterium]
LSGVPFLSKSALSVSAAVCYLSSTVLKLIFQILLAVVVFRLIGSLIGKSRGGKRRASFSRAQQAQPDPVEDHEYDKLTPYEIEDAQYEEIPKQN